MFLINWTLSNPHNYKKYQKKIYNIVYIILQRESYLFMKTHNPEFMNEKINLIQIYLISIENFCTTKETTNKVKR